MEPTTTTKKWVCLDSTYYSENTPEYGMGDYPEQRYFILAVVIAETKRKAQNAVKKLYPGTLFAARTPPWVFPESEFMETSWARLYPLHTPEGRVHIRSEIKRMTPEQYRKFEKWQELK